MAVRLTYRSAPLLAAAFFAASCGGGAGPASAAACDRYAAPDGSDRAAGTATAPFRSPTRLAEALAPGQTGCLRAGAYEGPAGGYVLRVNEGGRPGAPITVRSAPGERARLSGVVYVPQGSPHVVLADLEIDGRVPGASRTPSVHVMAEDVRFEGNTVTNRGLTICMLLGKPGWGRAVRTVVTRNLFHGCGDTRERMLHHAIYVEQAAHAEISRNIFHDNAAWAVHLYPDANGVRVVENVMHANGGGVIFAGEGDEASSGNIVERNVISGSLRDASIGAYWGDRVGTSNIAASNCVSGAEIVEPEGFSVRENLVSATGPGYVDAGARDFRLRPDSPCRSVVGDWSAGPSSRGSRVKAKAPTARKARLSPRCRRAVRRARTSRLARRCIRTARRARLA